MQLLSNIVIVLIVVLGPALVLYLVKRVKVLGMLGSVFLCYALGFALSFLFRDTSIAMSMSEILVPIAIPMILLSADFGAARRLAKPMIVSFVLMIAAVFLVACGAYFAFRDRFENASSLSGMMIGLYTGGTPNLMAIGKALGVPNSEIVLANTADVVVGGIYFLLLISVMPRLVKRFLPAFKLSAEPASPEGGAAETDMAQEIQNNYLPLKQRFTWAKVWPRAMALGIGVACLGAAAGIALLITGELNVMIIMLLVTTFGIAFSFIKKVRNAPGTFGAGQYVIYMFSFAIGLSFDLSGLTASMLLMLALFATVQFGSIALHLLFAKLFKIDGHTALITSTAGIYGPAFIVPTANALGNREVVLPGLICGILGYAIGNYLGIGTALLLNLF